MKVEQESEGQPSLDRSAQISAKASQQMLRAHRSLMKLYTSSIAGATDGCT